jgi:hypothetical protein
MLLSHLFTALPPQQELTHALNHALVVMLSVQPFQVLWLET